MDALWSYFWPAFAAGLVIGAIAGSVGFRLPLRRGKDDRADDRDILRAWHRKRRIALSCGFVLALAAAGLWHGPFGAADRFTGRVERAARQALDYYEMTQVTATLQRDPLSRHLVLQGPADDFQHSELVRVFLQLPGVSSVSWSNRRAGLPLLAEGQLAALVGFLLGLMLAYLVELRRRYNAQWTW